MPRAPVPCALTVAATLLLAASASAVPADLDADLLIWGEDEQERPWTFWVARGPGAPRLVARRPGVVLAAQGALWRWSAAPRTAEARLDCATMTPGPAGSGSDAAVVEARLERLVRRGEHARQIVVPAPIEMAASANELTHSVFLEGSVGPHLFVSDQAYVYDCGAHGNVTFGFRVWNAARGRPEDLRAALPARERRALATRALHALEGRFGPEPTDVEHRVVPRDVHPSRLAPVFDANGGLALEHAYYTDTCYACGDGEWHSYTRSARVASTVLPATLRAFARVAEVAWLARAQPALRIRGVSEVPASLRATFEAQPAGER